MLYADAIVLSGEGLWLKNSGNKPEYLRFNGDGNLDGNSEINLQGNYLETMTTFIYLEATLTGNGDLDAKMTHRIQSGWKNGKRRYRGFCVTE